MTALVVTVGLMLAVSFFCSIGEAALYAVPPVRVEALRLAGAPFGDRLARLRDRIEQPITAILFLNTFANTMGAAIAGGMFGKLYDPRGVLAFSLALTLAVLLVAEIVPKSLGVGYSRTVAPLLAWPIQVMVWLFYPLVRVGEGVTRAITPKRKQAGPSEEDIVALASLGVRGGTILAEEAAWVRNVLRLDQITARDIMTPRPVVVTVNGSRHLRELRDDLHTLSYSRLPVTTDEGPDHVTGIVLRRDIFNALLDGRVDACVADLQKPVQFVPATMRGHRLLTKFIEDKAHLAIVVDEYGGTMGVVTLEDIIEEMIGHEIVDETDVHADLREYARRKAASRLRDM